MLHSVAGATEPGPQEKQMSSKKAKPEMSSEFPADVTNFAQKSVDQAQATFEKVSEVAHGNVQMIDAAANAYKNRLTDIQLKGMEFAQLNVNAGFAFARKLLSVKEPAEAFNLQQAFVKDQAEALQRQATELSELAVTLAKESLKPVQETLTKSFSGFGKAFAA
jgi:phasin